MLRARRFLLAGHFCALLTLSIAAARPSLAKVRINGSTTVNPVVVEAAQALRAETDAEILIDTVGGSSGGLAALADGRAEIGMLSRPLTRQDRHRFPSVDFRAVQIGTDAVALVVSRDVWDGGLRSLSRDQVRDLYEGRVRNWQGVGGPDRRVVFFNKEPGRGTWEVFARWLYGDAMAAPLVNLPEVGSNEEGRNKVASTPGSVTQLSAAWADDHRVFALGLRDERGEAHLPTPENIARDTYPLARPLLLVTDGSPDSETQRILDFLTGSRGQRLVERHGYLSVMPSTPESQSP